MTNLRVIPAEPLGDNVIETLTEALALAEAGEVSSVGIVMVSRDGATRQSWSKTPSLGLLIASAAALQHRLLQRMIGE